MKNKGNMLWINIFVFHALEAEEWRRPAHLQRRHVGDAVQQAHQVCIDEEVLLPRQLCDEEKKDVLLNGHLSSFIFHLSIVHDTNVFIYFNISPNSEWSRAMSSSPSPTGWENAPFNLIKKAKVICLL